MPIHWFDTLTIEERVYLYRAQLREFWKETEQHISKGKDSKNFAGNGSFKIHISEYYEPKPYKSATYYWNPATAASSNVE